MASPPQGLAKDTRQNPRRVGLRGHRQSVIRIFIVESVLYLPLSSLVLCYDNAARCGGSTLEEHSTKAIVRTQYGSPDVLRFEEVASPTPADNEVMIKLYAASVNPLDLFLIKGAPWNRVIPGLRTPKHKVIGCDIAGRVETVGRNVKRFQPGDEVFGVTGFEGKGFAEYVCALEEKLGPKPANLSFADAAVVRTAHAMPSDPT